VVTTDLGVKWLWGFRSWHPVVSVVVAAGLGAVTNLVTGNAFSWTLVAVAAGLVLAQMALSVWQGRQDHRQRCVARDELLGELRPAVPDGAEDGPGVVLWLTAPFSPTPLWARDDVRDRLVAWCTRRDAEAGVVRVLAGSAGVGKSRLALAVAEALPAGWVAGMFRPVDGVVERIVSAGEPVLLIVEDADRVAGVDVLIGQAARHPALVRLLLLTREAASLRTLPDAVLPNLSAVEMLTPIGEEGDRTRWFAEAVSAYARTFGVPVPDLPTSPVGLAEDTPLVLHARALLAVHGRAGARTLTLREIATELVGLEQRHWQADQVRLLPAGCDTEVLAEAVTVLQLLPASNLVEAAALLRRVPQFAHDSANGTRIAVARWARRRYPPGADHCLRLIPNLVAERLLIDTLTRVPQLLHDLPAAAFAVLTRAYGTFADALDLLVTTLEQHRARSVALHVVLTTGVVTPDLDRALARLISPNDPGTFPIFPTSKTLDTLPHLGCAIARVVLARFRALGREQPDRYRPDLASALTLLGRRLRALGRPREALAADEEAVALRRELVDREPDRYRPDLATALTDLGANLYALGHKQAALALQEEVVALRRELTRREPDRYRVDLAGALTNLGLTRWDVGRPRDALVALTEAVAIRRELVRRDVGQRFELAITLTNLAVNLREVGRTWDALAAQEEAAAIRGELARREPRHRPELAITLSNMSVNLRDVGQLEEALAAGEEAVALFRELVAGEPDPYQADLATALNNLGANLWAAGRIAESLAVQAEAVGIRRRLAGLEPARHLADLAGALTNLGTSLSQAGRTRDAVAAQEEATAIRRELASQQPERHRHDLANSLVNLGTSLLGAMRLPEALTVQQEAAVLYRDLTDEEPDRYRAEYAVALNNLGLTLRTLGRHTESLDALRESVRVLRICADHDPKLHGPAYRRADAALRKFLATIGDDAQAITTGLIHDAAKGISREP
jgi:tetratricopeptide (TPR) repeat protein